MTMYNTKFEIGEEVLGNNGLLTIEEIRIKRNEEPIYLDDVGQEYKEKDLSKDISFKVGDVILIESNNKFELREITKITRKEVFYKILRTNFKNQAKYSPLSMTLDSPNMSNAFRMYKPET